MGPDNEASDSDSRKRTNSNSTLGWKRKKHAHHDVTENERLEKLVLGNASYMLGCLGVKEDDLAVNEGYVPDSAIYQPAWKDGSDLGKRADHDGSLAQNHHRKKFTNTFGQPAWAKLGGHSSDDQDEAVLRTVGNFSTKPSYLPKGIINVKRLASLNNETRNEGPVIKTVEFHPSSTVALVAGLSGTASLFQVDGKANKKLASINFEKFPIRCSHFNVSGTEFLVGSQHHPFFYIYDMMAGATRKVPFHSNMEQTNMKNFQMSGDGRFIAVGGRFGQIHLLSADSKEWIANLPHNSDVTSFTFSPDGDYLFSHTDTGEIYVWDMISRRVMSRFSDEGTLVCSSMAVSNEYLATGSSWGVVNLYENPKSSSSPCKPIKFFNNLVTAVTSLKFNSTSQILAMASDDKEDQIKLVHTPSMTVFSNFPSVNANLGRIQALDFSPASGFMACANAKSTAFLYRLSHYASY